MTHWRNVLLFLVLSGTAVATWLLGRPDTPPAPATAGRESTPQGYYLRDAVIHGTNVDGEIAYRVYAAFAERPAQDQDLVLTTVRVEYDERENVPWLVTAARAMAAADGDLIRLYDVSLRRQPRDGSQESVIETQEIELFPATHEARAVQPVIYSSGGARVEAGGFTADLKLDRIDLVGIHGQFQR